MATLAVAMLGSAATAATATTAATAATTGMLGTAGSFALAQAIPTALGALSAVTGIASSASQAKSLETVANYNADIKEQQAKEERATGLREASEERRQGRLSVSSLIAQAAKGGGGIDPTSMKVLGNIAGEAEFRAGVKVADSERAAQSLETGADLGKYEAYQQSKTARRKGITTALGTIGSLF